MIPGFYEKLLDQFYPPCLNRLPYPYLHIVHLVIYAYNGSPFFGTIIFCRSRKTKDKSVFRNVRMACVNPVSSQLMFTSFYPNNIPVAAIKNE